MPSTPTQLFRGAASTTSATLYTNTAGTTTVLSTIAITNTTAATVTATVAVGGTVILGTINVDANSTVVIDNVRQVLTSTQTVTGFASSTSVNFHISGTVIS